MIHSPVISRNKALTSWRTLRNAALNTSAPSTLAEEDAMRIEHGCFKFEQSIMPTPGLSIDCVVFNSNAHQLWVEDFDSARRWTGSVFSPTYNLPDHERARPFVPSTHSVKISERQSLMLLFHAASNCFIGFSDDDHTLRLFDANLQLVSKTTTVSPVACACVDPFTSEVYFGCTGKIAVYTLRRGRIFTLKTVLDDGLPRDAVVTCIVVDYSAEKLHHRVFIAYGRNIVVYDIGGSFLTTITEAHARPVSELLYFDDVDLLVSAGRDGSIKMWDNNWELVHMFSGHTSEVTCLARYPTLALMLSTSTDQSIRVWNMNTLDCVSTIQTSEPVLGAGFLASPNRFYTYSQDKVTLWLSNQLQLDFALVGEPVSDPL